MRNYFLTMGFFVMTCTSVSAQLVPGKNNIERKWIKPGKYEMSWYMKKDTSKFEIAKVFVEIQVDKEKLIAVTTVAMKGMQHPWIDSTIANARTLAPIYHSSYNMQRDMVLNFANPVTGYYFNKMKKTQTVISDTTSTQYFDSNLYPDLIGWLPLSEGYHTDLLIYDYNPSGKKGVMKAFVKDVKSGVYTSKKSGERNVWIVTVADEIGNGENGTSLYFFDKKDRKLWKQEISAGGRDMFMEAVE